MKANPKQLAATLLTAAEGKSGAALDETVYAFLEMMHGRGELHRTREVMRAVDTQWRKRYGVSRVSVESAHALPVKVQQAVDKLAKGADVFFSIDPSLIGGARVRVDDLVIDNTVLGRADRLKRQLMERI
ncbi:hypothetical protein EPO34_00900 [Patescibacteria group bacterium]|nr:MAG: hypothetical protein EPO34_00900 [Patescibacteria group bacterium]